jgi:hypothetical protein
MNTRCKTVTRTIEIPSSIGSRVRGADSRTIDRDAHAAIVKDKGDQLGPTYSLHCQLRDLDDYDRAFCRKAMHGLEGALRHNGVFVVDMHPEYFGAIAYLLHPRTLARLIWFAPTYLTRVLRLSRDQERLSNAR